MAFKLKVLLVEDYQPIRELIRHFLLECAGLEIIGEAASGREALERVVQLAPHVVLLDISLPDTNGLDAIRRIREVAPKTKVVVLAEYGSREYGRAIGESGADLWLLKESVGENLAAAMRRIRSQVDRDADTHGTENKTPRATRRRCPKARFWR